MWKIENSIKTALKDMDIETENTVEEIEENIKMSLQMQKNSLKLPKTQYRKNWMWIKFKRIHRKNAIKPVRKIRRNYG